MITAHADDFAQEYAGRGAVDVADRLAEAALWPKDRLKQRLRLNLAMDTCGLATDSQATETCAREALKELAGKAGGQMGQCLLGRHRCVEKNRRYCQEDAASQEEQAHCCW